ISARCTASAVKGSATLLTPQCATRVISCPATATSCSVVVNVRESAVRGPEYVIAGVSLSSGYTSATVLTPYNCPQLFSCGTRVQLNGLTPGETVQLGVANALFAPNYPVVFGQLSLTAH